MKNLPSIPALLSSLLLLSWTKNVLLLSHKCIFSLRLRYRKRRYRLSPKPVFWKIRLRYHRKIIYRRVVLRRGRTLIRFGKKRYTSIRNLIRRRRYIRRYKRRVRRIRRRRLIRRRRRRYRRRRLRKIRRRRRRYRRRRRLINRRRFRRRYRRIRRLGRRRPRGRRVRRVRPRRRFRIRRPSRSRRRTIFHIRIGRRWSRVVRSRKAWYFNRRRLRINRKGIFYKKGRVYKRYPKFRLR